MPGIYLKSGDAYLEMTETPFDREDILQKLIAQHPELLADEEAGQGQLLLVRREAAVKDDEETGGRWSLDHLYVDSSGVPTLVEVKRSSDTQARREVVAQMLDYAANAKISFNADQMAAWVEENARKIKATGGELLADTLGVDDAEAFWQAVDTNLEAERFRLIFVSDGIPRELRRIIEFLNAQLSPTEVLAIEVKQYVGNDHQHQTIVPRVIGDTAVAKRARPRSRAPINRGQLLSSLRAVDPKAAAAATALLEWADERPDLDISWTRAADIRLHSMRRRILRIWDEGTLEVRVNAFRKIDPPWNDDRIEGLLQRLEQIDGVQLTGSRLRWPRTPLAPLAETSNREEFQRIMVEAIDDI